MRVFLTGASGFIGSALINELLAAGHEVLGLARSEESAKLVRALGAQAHRGSLDDLASLRSGAAQSDGVIHTAFIHTFSNISMAERLKVIFGGFPNKIATRFLSTIGTKDQNAIAAIGSVLAGSGRPLVITSGTLILPLGRLVHENDTADFGSPAGYRMPSEETTIRLASMGVRSSIVRLPPTVHGDGDHGFINNLIIIARKKGVSAYINNGLNRWPAVHRLDAVRLFRLALEKGVAGTAYHGVGEQEIHFRDIAEVIGRKLNEPVNPKTANHFGFLGQIVASDNPTSSKLTREWLGWTPENTSLIADLEQGHYFKSV